METTAKNKLIAEFMGEIISAQQQISFSLNCTPNEFKYHSSWEWLMPVVKKIGEICNEQASIFSDENQKRVEIFKQVSIFSSLNEIYSCVLQFIEWYNQESNH